jgi:CheY-like chemotaxis protein
MVQRHDAEIEIESTLGRGTLVRLVFAMPAVDREPSSAPAPVRLPRTSLRVLVVDDDPLLLKSLQDVLESDGHSVVPAAGGELGIALFRKALQEASRFDVVITDLGMPHIDGRQVATSVKELAGDAPVILLTGWGQRLFDEADFPAHVDRVLRKPPRLSELRQALVELTESSEFRVHSSK